MALCLRALTCVKSYRYNGGMRENMKSVAWFWGTVARFEARRLWQSLPGPWPVKVLLIVLTQAIPGPQDELLLLAVVAGWRAWRRHKRARLA